MRLGLLHLDWEIPEDFGCRVWGGEGTQPGIMLRGHSLKQPFSVGELILDIWRSVVTAGYNPRCDPRCDPCAISHT